MMVIMVIEIVVTGGVTTLIDAIRAQTKVFMPLFHSSAQCEHSSVKNNKN